MKRLLAATTLVLAGAAQASVISGFNGPFDIGNWTFSPGGGGSLQTAAAPDAIGLVGGDDGSAVDSATDLAIAISNDMQISFSWSYTTDDDDAFWDPFGYLLESIPGAPQFTQLTLDGSAAPQAGSASVFVKAGERFGFRAFSIGSEFGASSTTISDFRAMVVPEPGALALVGLALMGLTLSRKRAATV